jgi:hypothetical protein
MVVPSQVDLVDRSILLAPVCKLDEAILFRNFRDRPDDGIA